MLKFLTPSSIVQLDEDRAHEQSREINFHVCFCIINRLFFNKRQFQDCIS